jgi:hypothetical protein
MAERKHWRSCHVELAESSYHVELGEGGRDRDSSDVGVAELSRYDRQTLNQPTTPRIVSGSGRAVARVFVDAPDDVVAQQAFRSRHHRTNGSRHAMRRSQMLPLSFSRQSGILRRKRSRWKCSRDVLKSTTS